MKPFLIFLFLILFILYSFCLLKFGLQKVQYSSEDFESPRKLGKRNEFPLMLLVSLPGSGNSWFRQLFEESTGYFTGSAYFDDALISGGLLGEATRFEDGLTPLVKTHSVKHADFSKAQGAILLIRNPYDATVAEWERKRTKSHTSVASASIFQDGLFDQFAKKNLLRWRKVVNEVFNYAANLVKKVKIIYYEDLVRNATAELEKVFQFFKAEINWDPVISWKVNSEGRFHRKRQTPALEYFRKSLIELGDYNIHVLEEFLLQVGEPVFSKNDYLRGNKLNYEYLEEDILKNRNIASRYKSSLASKKPKKFPPNYFQDPLMLWKNECSPQDGLILLRKHKSASSTLKAMADKYLAIIGVESEEPFTGPQGGCFPAKFDERCWAGSTRNEPVLAMTFHFRWNMEYLPSILDKNRRQVKTLTSIRNPLDVFRSALSYFNRPELTQNCDFACWGEPYRSLLGESSEQTTVNEVIEALPRNFSIHHPLSFRVSNMQSFELGMDVDKMNDTSYVLNYLKRLEKQFDLVILAEYFMEGVVLLKHMLCCEYEDLYVPSKNVKEYEKIELTDKQLKIYSDFNKADLLMYDFFNKTFHRKIKAFGKKVRLRMIIN